MERQALHPAAERRQSAVVDGPQLSQQAQSRHRSHSALGGSNQSIVLGLPPQAMMSSSGPDRSMRWMSGSRCGRSRSASGHRRIAKPGTEPRRAPGALLGGIARDALGFQAVDRAIGIVAGDLVQSRVHDRRDAGHRERRFRDVGREDHAARRRSAPARHPARPRPSIRAARRTSTAAPGGTLHVPEARRISGAPGRKQSTWPVVAPAHASTAAADRRAGR